MVRDNPEDIRSRTFLFELLSFAGEYSRADKQLEVLAQAGPDSEMGVLLYRGALYAERQRQSLFLEEEAAVSLASANNGRSGSLNGVRFSSFSDADPRFPSLEIFAAGNYMLLPFEHVESLTIKPPSRLRDLLWIPAVVRTASTFRGTDLGSILLPALSPGTSKHSDEMVRLGRATVWEKSGKGDDIYAFGQKMFLVDGEEVPFLEVRALEFDPSPVGV